MSQNAIWYDNLLDFFMLFVLIMQIGTQLGHEKVVKMDPFFGCLGYTEYQKGVVVEAQSWHLCTGSGFIPGKSQNTLELAIATGKCRKSLLAAEARLWPAKLVLSSIHDEKSSASGRFFPVGKHMERQETGIWQKRLTVLMSNMRDSQVVDDFRQATFSESRAYISALSPLF